MAWYLKFPANAGNPSNNKSLVQISGITGTLATISYVMAENMPAFQTGGARYILDARRQIDSIANGGTLSAVLQASNAAIEQYSVSAITINGVSRTAADLFSNTIAVADSVCQFNIGLAPSQGCIAFGARFNEIEHAYGMAVKSITIIDSAGTHLIDMSSSNGTATQFTSTDGLVTLKLFNFNPATCWIFYSSGATYQLTALGGTFSYSGAQASLLRRFRLQTLGASYAYSGASANLTYVPTGTVYTLTALGGSFSYSGGSANVRASRKLVAQGGSYSYSGGQASLLRRFRLVANGGVYSYSGGSANLTYNQLPGVYRLTALGATYTYTGGIATLTATGVTPMANAGAYVIQAYVGGTQTISAKIGGRQTINAMVAI